VWPHAKQCCTHLQTASTADAGTTPQTRQPAATMHRVSRPTHAPQTPVCVRTWLPQLFHTCSHPPTWCSNAHEQVAACCAQLVAQVSQRLQDEPGTVGARLVKAIGALQHSRWIAYSGSRQSESAGRTEEPVESGRRVGAHLVKAIGALQHRKFGSVQQ
jgi:hypothetical protein